MIRVTRASFFHFCDLIRECGLLENSIHMCVEQQVAIFLHTIGHNVRNRLVSTNFTSSGETIAGISIQYFTLLESYAMTSLGHHHRQYRLKSYGTHDGILTLR
jgi:hypothetical protein